MRGLPRFRSIREEREVQNVAEAVHELNALTRSARNHGRALGRRGLGRGWDP